MKTLKAFEVSWFSRCRPIATMNHHSRILTGDESCHDDTSPLVPWWPSHSTHWFCLSLTLSSLLLSCDYSVEFLDQRNDVSFQTSEGPSFTGITFLDLFQQIRMKITRGKRPRIWQRLVRCCRNIVALGERHVTAIWLSFRFRWSVTDWSSHDQWLEGRVGQRWCRRNVRGQRGCRWRSKRRWR